MKFTPVYSSIPVLVIGLTVNYLLFFAGCSGVAEMYPAVFLTVLLTLYLVGLYVYSLTIYLTRKTGVNFLPLLITIAFSGLIALINHFNTEQFKGRITLKASNNKPYGRIDLRLRENNKVEFAYGHIEEMCSCNGSFSMEGDTLLVKGIKATKTFKPFDRYLLTDSYVIPIVNKKVEVDSANYLKRLE